MSRTSLGVAGFAVNIIESEGAEVCGEAAGSTRVSGGGNRPCHAAASKERSSDFERGIQLVSLRRLRALDFRPGRGCKQTRSSDWVCGRRQALHFVVTVAVVGQHGIQVISPR